MGARIAYTYQLLVAEFALLVNMQRVWTEVSRRERHSRLILGRKNL